LLNVLLGARRIPVEWESSATWNLTLQLDSGGANNRVKVQSVSITILSILRSSVRNHNELVLSPWDKTSCSKCSFRALQSFNDWPLTLIKWVNYSTLNFKASCCNIVESLIIWKSQGNWIACFTDSFNNWCTSHSTAWYSQSLRNSWASTTCWAVCSRNCDIKLLVSSSFNSELNNLLTRSCNCLLVLWELWITIRNNQVAVSTTSKIDINKIASSAWKREIRNSR